MSESAVPASGSGMDMETVLTRAVKKLFKWQLSGLSGTLIVAAMLWFTVFLFFFLILAFVMCVEYRYDKRERQDAELALPKDNDKKWAETRSSRETSKTSLKKVAPIPMPPLPVTGGEPKAVIVPDVPESEPEPASEPPTRIQSPTNEAVTEESVIVDAPADDEPEARSPTPPPAAEEEPEESPPADEEQAPPEEETAENTQDEGAADAADEATDADPPPEPEEPQPEAEGDAAAEGEEEKTEEATSDEKNDADNANTEVGSPSKTSVHSKKGED